MSLLKILFVILFSFSIGFLKAQSPTISVLKKYVKNYTEEDFQKDPQNWSLCADKEGLLYFGNYNNVLQFNGEKWSSIPVSNQAKYITALHYTAGDTLYWGGGGDFGYLTPQANGLWKTTSLKIRLPELDQYFSQVWRVFPYQGKVVFFTQESIFLYNPALDSLQTIYPQNSFHLAFVVQNQLFARDRSFGLMRFDGKAFTEIDGGEVFLNEGVFAMVESTKDSILVISQTLGYYFYLPKEQKIIKHESPYNAFITQQELMGAVPISHEKIAMNTASNGVFIADNRGKIEEQISLQSGISDNDVKGVLEDRFGNLWLATNNGISFVNYASKQSFYLDDEQSALLGSANSVEEFQGQMYVGTTSGLFRYHSQKFIFEAVAGLEDNLTALCATPSALFVGTTSALYKLSGNLVEKVLDADIRSIDYSRQNHCLYVAGNNGFYVLCEKKQWKLRQAYPDITINVLKSLIMHKNGVDELWLGTLSDGLYVLNANPKAEIQAQHFVSIDGTPGHYVMPFILDGKPAFGMPSGVWEIYQDSALVDSSHQMEMFFVPHSNEVLEKSVVFEAEPSPFGDILIFNGNLARFDQKDSIHKKDFQGLQIGKINDIKLRGEHELWVASNKGITVIDIIPPRGQYPTPDIHIDNFYLLPDSLLLSGITPAGSIQIDFAVNSFRIEFSSLYSINGFKAEYSYMLENYDEEWSEWTSLPFVEYKRVHEGDYVFKVRSRNIYGMESEEKDLRISILPPWYRSWWAYVLYGVVFILLVVGITRAYVYRLKQKNKQLEAIIKERTREIVEQKDEIEKQRDLITEAHEEIQASIQYARRIQSAVLPSGAIKQAAIRDYFILFKPRDVVSGDFYWARQSGDYLIITAADCTGHGVPGAFMSMLGVSLLNDIVGKEGVVEAGSILNELRNGVIQSLKQDKQVEEGLDLVKDGMDISLLSIHLKTGKITWAGAHNPLFIIAEEKPQTESDSKFKVHEFEGKKRKIYELKADKMPIAIADRMEPFVSHHLQLHEGDQLYLFSDGFVDQFGGPRGKKFMIRAFRQLLMRNAHLPMEQQHKSLENTLKVWMAHTTIDNPEGFKQVDDVTVIGIGV